MTRYGNRGMWFENAIESTNKVYKAKNKAQIDKIATPISYNPKTRKGYYKDKSTVDFVGCNNKGQLVAFDAKQTAQKSLSYSNVTDHQVNYLRRVKRLGADAFFLVYFKEFGECWKLDIDDYLTFKMNNTRKSIPYKYFTEKAKHVVSQNGAIFDYLN